MVDFITAFEAGLNAAGIADKNKREINSVFEELNKQLAKATDGKVNIELRTPSLLRLIYAEQSKKNQAIYAFNPLIKSADAKELARWNLDPNGYPCKISFSNKELYCGDKSALERTLADMLQDPTVGEALSKLIQLSEAKESE